MSQPVERFQGTIREFIAQLRLVAEGGQRAIERRCEMVKGRRDRSPEEERQWQWWDGYWQALADVEDRIAKDEEAGK